MFDSFAFTACLFQSEPHSSDAISKKFSSSTTNGSGSATRSGKQQKSKSDIAAAAVGAAATNISTTMIVGGNKMPLHRKMTTRKRGGGGGGIGDDLLAASTAAVAAAKTDQLPTDMSDSSDSEASMNIPPFVSTAECNSMHEGRQLVHTILPINVDTLFSLLFSKSKFLVDFHNVRKTTNMIHQDWSISEDGVKSRQVTLTVALAQAVGPKCSHVSNLFLVLIYEHYIRICSYR